MRLKNLQRGTCVVHPPPLYFEGATRGCSIDPPGTEYSHQAARECLIPNCFNGQIQVDLNKGFVYLR